MDIEIPLHYLWSQLIELLIVSSSLSASAENRNERARERKFVETARKEFEQNTGTGEHVVHLVLQTVTPLLLTMFSMSHVVRKTKNLFTDRKSYSDHGRGYFNLVITVIGYCTPTVIYI